MLHENLNYSKAYNTHMYDLKTHVTENLPPKWKDSNVQHAAKGRSHRTKEFFQISIFDLKVVLNCGPRRACTSFVSFLLL